ncbi:MAG: tRNA lysidine(34) synthetase TilS [Clostridiales bacterium]|jgi:tRNA(Ile)-lysidine synthase|nr:tRNA lysidine(34) synthetase TilS [Clostridiales bacterium]
MENILDFFTQNPKFTHAPLILGVSGGADSLALLHYLHALKYNIIVAHIDHSLRPTSHADSIHVQNICASLNLPCHAFKTDIAELAKQNKQSLETAGRAFRYSSFAQLAAQLSGVIVTAHNKNDTAESFIMHLLRGSGTSGLCGIPPISTLGDLIPSTFQNIQVIRPMLNTPRSNIEQYCLDNNLKYITDETNTDTSYFRNDIRHNIMPLLYARGGLDSITRTSQIISTEHDFWTEHISNLINTNIHDKTFSVKWFNSLHLAEQRLVLKAVLTTPRTVSKERIDSIITMCQKNYGNKTIEVTDGYKITLNKGVVTIAN